MNNRGFAITGIIYGLMLLFILVLTSFMSVLIGRNKRIDALIADAYGDIEYATIYVKENNGVFSYKKENDPDFTQYVAPDNRADIYITSERALYKFNDVCTMYLPENVMVITGKLKNGTEDSKLYYNKLTNEVPDYSTFNELTCIS